MVKMRPTHNFNDEWHRYCIVSNIKYCPVIQMWNETWQKKEKQMKRRRRGDTQYAYGIFSMFHFQFNPTLMSSRMAKLSKLNRFKLHRGNGLLSPKICDFHYEPYTKQFISDSTNVKNPLLWIVLNAAK